MRRLYPNVVTLLGGVSLGLALMYFVAVVLAFVPGWEAWAEFFVPIAIYLVVPPYVLLVVHLVLRNHVGRYLLNRRAYNEAEEYARHRLKASLMRSRREAANHRIVCARALIGQGNYDAARDLLRGQHRRLPGAYAMEARRWQLELALRGDDHQTAEKLTITEPKKEKSARGELAAALSCEAELALRKGDVARFKQRMMAAIWDKSTHPRTGLCRALALAEYESEGDESEELLKLLELVEDTVVGEIPARRGEILALRALGLWRSGRKDDARKQLTEAKQLALTDYWTDKVIEEVAVTIQ